MYLEQAVHDEQHTRTGDARLVHFWDADSLFFTAFGFRMLRPRDDLATNTLMAQALLSAGLLGPVSMLSHHRVELFSQLDRRVRDLDESHGSDAEDLGRFLDSHPDLDGAWNQAVQTIRKATAAQTMASTIEALRTLETIDRSTFVLFEATAQSLPDRIRRVLTDHSLVDYSAAELPKTKHVLGDPRFSMFLEGLSRYRHDQHERTANIAADAAALTTLALLNDRASASKSPVYPRFFTSTSSLRNLYSSEEWVRQELRYSVRADRRRTGTVWRDSGYYVIKSMFPCLNSATSFPASALVPDRPTFEELADLSGELVRAIQTGDGELEELADSYLLSDGKRLADVIEDLQDSGRAAAWLRLRPAHYAKRWAEGVREIRAYSTHALTREAINSVFENVTSEMREEILDAGCHTGLLRAYSAIFTKLAHASAGERLSRIEQMGSIRWGVTSSRLGEFLQLAETPAQRLGQLKSASVKWLLRSAKRLEAACVCLLAVDDFTSVIRLVERMPEGKRSAPLVAMALGARIRERRVFLPEELRAMMNECTSTFEELPASEKLRLCVAFGYSAFHIWRRSTEASTSEWPTDELGWADWSCRVVESRMEALDGRLLPFALNHIVYVQSVANLKRPDANTLAVRLKNLAEVSGLYRLADTIGNRITIVARRETLWSENRAAWLLRHDRELAEAAEWLRIAQTNAFSDREVDQHVELLDATLRDARFAWNDS